VSGDQDSGDDHEPARDLADLDGLTQEVRGQHDGDGRRHELEVGDTGRAEELDPRSTMTLPIDPARSPEYSTASPAGTSGTRAQSTAASCHAPSGSITTVPNRIAHAVVRKGEWA
jgi:hypothetical protein